MSEVTIYIQGALPTLNEYIDKERGNKYAAASMKKKATNTVALQARAQVKEIRGICDYEFTWHVKNKRKDKDNIAFAKKFIFDGLIAASIIKNDGWQQVGSMSDRFEIAPEEHVVIRVKPA